LRAREYLPELLGVQGATSRHALTRSYTLSWPVHGDEPALPRWTPEDTEALRCAPGILRQGCVEGHCCIEPNHSTHDIR
jgi:hypothetical protein